MTPVQVPILAYHAIDERPSAISIPPRTFEWQMHQLHHSGFHVIPLSLLVQCLRTGTPPPDRSVVITFDDGLGSVYTDAFPVLERFGFPATVFLVAGYCGKQNHWPPMGCSSKRTAGRPVGYRQASETRDEYMAPAGAVLSELPAAITALTSMQ